MLLLGELTALVARAGHIFRPTSNFDVGLDGEIEFNDAAGEPSGRRVYVQLKSGDSYLTRRKSDGEELFRVAKKRHLKYWSQQAYPVMLVIRQSSGVTRWMDMSAYIQLNGVENVQVTFRGEVVNVDAIQKLGQPDVTSPLPDP